MSAPSKKRIGSYVNDRGHSCRRSAPTLQSRDAPDPLVGFLVEARGTALRWPQRVERSAQASCSVSTSTRSSRISSHSPELRTRLDARPDADIANLRAPGDTEPSDVHFPSVRFMEKVAAHYPKGCTSSGIISAGSLERFQSAATAIASFHSKTRLMGQPGGVVFQHFKGNACDASSARRRASGAVESSPPAKRPIPSGGFHRLFLASSSKKLPEDVV